MKSGRYRARRILSVVGVLVALIAFIIANPNSYEKEIVEVDASATSDGKNSFLDQSQISSTTPTTPTAPTTPSTSAEPLATEILKKLEIKGRAPKTGYARTEFYNNWPTIDGCNLRQRIIKREVGESAKTDENCNVISGTFVELYTGETRTYTQKSDFSNHIQIDHVVALSDAWQKGAQYKTADERYQMATDPLNLLAVDGPANQKKSDGDAATWLPPNKAFRCQYVARQVSVKYKYGLWVTQAEHDAISGILKNCPNEIAVGVISEQ